MIARIATKASCLFLLTMLSFGLKAQLAANFTATPTSGCAPLVVHFTDSSTNNPTQWKWDLGNGTVSFLQNPSVTYFNPGQYTIKLVVTNSAGADSITKTQYINVYAQPTVQFTSSVNSGCFPLPVQFTDQSTAGNGTIDLWQWDFGDGFSSALQHPTHTYTAAGNYNVTLRVRNSNGCITTLSKAQYIQISSGVKADFSNTIPNNCSFPVTINFKNLSTGTGTLTYKWLFGDGSVSTQMDPSYTYTALGTYTVKLIVTNANGCTDTITKANTIVVSKVKASFTNSDTVCVQQPFLISNTSVPAPLSNTWTFGDGTISAAANPIKTFTTAGSYQVKLVANFGACTDSVSKTIIVSQKPTAAFVADRTISCSIPLTVNFTNQSLNAIAYHWNFGDSITSILPNPAHTYSHEGNFSVQLIVTNANGCTDTLQKTGYIKIQKPVVALNNLPDSGCIPFTKYFTATTNTLDPVVSYLWNFGDGTSSTLATPSHTFITAGVYAVTLIITTADGCTDTATIARGIIANTKPAVNFTATPKNTCANTAVNFTDLTTGTATNWLWQFGDGSSSTLQNPAHIYSDTGKFSVQLIVWNSGCTDTLQLKDFIHINPPIARFVVNMDCKKPYERVFTDQSIGADEWNWNFGDGSTSTQQSPVHQYAGPGFYEVSLLVKNKVTGCDFVTKKTIQIVDVKAAFTSADSVICKGGSISFITNLNTAEVSSFNWNFGDGTALITANNSATHTYSAAGNYTVRLIITTILGCQDTLTKTMNIRVNGPTAKFNSSVPGSCLNNAIVFNDLSVSDGLHPIQSFTWNYGDGNIETLTAGPFQHTYSAAGVYVVKLKVTDSLGCVDSFNIPTALVISKPLANFITTDTLSCPTQPVRFTNQSTGPNLTYLWKFGDGTTSTQQNPVHTFTADGIFSISLFITDQYGCTDSISKTKYVTIITPVADFIMSDSLSACPPMIVQLTDLSVNAITKNWNFGDGTSATTDNPSHFYNYPGTYIVTLTVKGPGGCSVIKQKPIVIKGPTGTFNYNPLIGCSPVNSSFAASTSGSSSIVWDFNDGTTINTTDSTINHVYTYPGTYVPKIILTDNAGCQVPIQGKDTIVVNGVTTLFNFENKTLCDSGKVSFVDASFSNDLITTYHWSMGDGTVSSANNPVHQYINNGLYYPKLIITTKHGCIDSMLASVPVKVVASPKINMVTTANGCTPLTMVVKGQVSVADSSALSWNWNFGNGDSSTLQNPSALNYSTAGVYTISLIATNSSGCTDTVNKNVEAYSIPTVRAGQDTFICQRRGVTLGATGANTYNWSPATGLSCVSCANPVATPDSAINYIVKGTSIHGCTAFDTINVAVKYPFKIIYSNRDTLCKGQSGKLFARGASTYTWTPATGLNNSTSATPIAQPDTTTNYRVVGTDDKSCFSDTGHVFIKVYPVPVVNAGEDKTINIGKTADLLPTISSDVTTVLWSPTTGIFRNSYPGITVKPTTNTDYTVEVKNAGGCTAQDRVSIFVICNGTNVFIPNTFSPNGDGANDIFFPRGSGLFKVKTLRIFNRWGEVVFEKNSFDANDAASGWDGTFKGAKLNPDVFVYTIDIICDNNTILNYKGNVALIQ
jgi:gliding motility-associated-like protein